MENKTKKVVAVANKSKVYNISRPSEVIQAAVMIKDYIVKHKLYADIKDKKYILVEGWQFAGGLLGLFPRVVSIEEKGVGKWLVRVNIINQSTEKVMGTGYALCSKEEHSKRNFDEYAIMCP